MKLANVRFENQAQVVAPVLAPLPLPRSFV